MSLPGYLFSFIALVSFLGTTSSQANPVEQSITPFIDKVRFDMQQVFKGGRLPNVVVATNGTVLVTWGATGGGGDWSKKGLEIRRSTDGGNTWSPSTSIANPGWQAGGLTVDETSGNILAFVEHWKWPVPPPPPDIYRSSDHGKTWRIQKALISRDSLGNIPSMHMAEHGITLRNGRNAGRLLRAARFYAKEDRPTSFPQHYNTAIYSDDGGTSWKTSMPFPAKGTGEGAIVELASGRVYYNSRRHWDPEGLNLMRWEAWSDDGGETWKDLSRSKILPDGSRGKGSNGCLGGLTRLPVNGRDIILYSNCDSDTRERRNLSIWASFDGAKTWPLKRLVMDGPSAYSSLASGRPKTTSEGWIYLLFEGGKKHRHEGAYLARFNLSWILAGEETGDGNLPDWL